MEKISLYIAGKKVDIDNNSFILFNYTMEDLSNPTIVKNSFSKQISIKGTPVNNEIFGNLWRADRKTMFGEEYIGIQFDPLRKTPFTIYNDKNEVIESGYVKVDSIAKVADVYEYKITLYGGLGSFFYGLTYDSDGNKRTLADLEEWLFYDEQPRSLPKFSLTKETLVNQAWQFISQGVSYLQQHPEECWDIINFAPAYNGIPSDFDANKVLYHGFPLNPFSNVSDYEIVDGVKVYYGRQEGCTSLLATLANKHTEWEVRDLRSYLQRPVIRIKAIIDAIVLDAKKQGFQVVLDSTFFNNSNAMYYRSWMTLPLLAKADRHTDDVMSALLKSSLSPSDYLLGFAKYCGLVFMYDNKTIRILTRNSFYSGQTLDLTNRIDCSSIDITPLVVEHKWYQLGGDKVVGEDAKKYQEKWGKPYGCMRVNTGYEFDAGVSQLTQSIGFTTAADVMERNFAFANYHASSVGYSVPYHPLHTTEDIKVQMFKRDDKTESKEFTISPRVYPGTPWNKSQPFNDFVPKVQFHGEDNKSEQGEHCIVFMLGAVNLPKLEIGNTIQDQLTFYVSDDHPDTDVLNSGTPCWNLDIDLILPVVKLPDFRRSYVSRGYTIEWGIPQEIFTGDNFKGVLSVYDRYWRSYLTDRYDVDTKKMKCKVNLSGMQVGQDLMRNFFFYENTIWMLNKINNHSITTDDLTECEFIKVKDVNNYKHGQIL